MQYNDGREDANDYYIEDHVFIVPKDALWSNIATNSKQPNLGQLIDEAFNKFKEENKYKYNFDVKANCHQFSASEYGQNVKIMTIDGKFEAIYNIDTGEQVTDPRDIGTYNYYNPNTNPIKHGIVDVLPWILWGNSEDDTTTVGQRIWYSIKGPKWFK